jgi:AcrR family transcriptional regulator
MTIRKRDWLMTAFHLLSEQGVDAITIAQLTAQLGVTKGSFYHHFQDMTDFREQMLELCLEESVTRVIEQVEQAPTPLSRLLLLEDVAYGNSALEVAVRAWALRDALAQRTLLQIDQQRQEYLRRLFAALGVSETDVESAARHYYAVFIGALHLMPPLTREQIDEAFAAVRRLYGISSS